MQRSRVVRAWLALPVAVSAAGACGGGDARPALSTRDSASVHIVESAAPAWRPGEEWRLDPEPLLDIGTADGEDPYLFDYVETALRMEDGSIVVADAASGQLRFFDASGRHVRSVGRRGGGPGEFGQSSVHIWLAPSGEIVAEDAGNRRVNRFDRTGEFRGTVVLATPSTGERPSILGVLADGRWLVQTSESGKPDSDGRVHGQVRYSRYEADGRHAATLAGVPGPDYMVVSTGRFSSWLNLPFSPEPFAAAHGRDVLVNAGGATQLDRFDSGGRLLASYRWHAPRRKSADLFDQYKLDQLAGGDSGWRRMQQAFFSRNLPIPPLVPAYVRMVVDHAGNIWLQRYYLTSDTERLNDVVAADGQWLGTVRLPPGYWLLQAGPDFALAWKRDDLGVEHVVLHRLQRGRVP